MNEEENEEELTPEEVLWRLQAPNIVIVDGAAFSIQLVLNDDRDSTEKLLMPTPWCITSLFRVRWNSSGYVIKGWELGASEVRAAPRSDRTSVVKRGGIPWGSCD